MLLEINGEITREKEEMEPKQKNTQVVDVTGDVVSGSPLKFII